MITEVANESNTVLIDVRTVFLCKDGIHQNI